MRRIKQMFKAVYIFIFGGLLQNKDNNYSIQNQEENMELTAEFYFYRDFYSELNLVKNQINTFEKIKQYVTKMDKITSEEEQRKRAADTYIKFRESMLIDNDCKLLKGVDEYITDFIS